MQLRFVGRFVSSRARKGNFATSQCTEKYVQIAKLFRSINNSVVIKIEIYCCIFRIMRIMCKIKSIEKIKQLYYNGGGYQLCSQEENDEEVIINACVSD